MEVIYSKKYPRTVVEKLAFSGFAHAIQTMLDGGSFAILSAHYGRDNLTPEGKIRNDNKAHELHELLRQFRVGFFKTKGAWKDDNIQTSDEMKKYIPEDSVFISPIRYLDAQTIAALYNQDGFIWGENGSYGIYQKNNKGVWKAGIFGLVKEHFRQIPPPADVYTEIKGRQFTFDPEQPNRAKALREELEKRKNQNKLGLPPIGVPPTGIPPKTASLKEIESTYFFYSIDKELECKYINHKFGVQSESEWQTPHGSLLECYFPIYGKVEFDFSE